MYLLLQAKDGFAEIRLTLKMEILLGLLLMVMITTKLEKNTTIQTI